MKKILVLASNPKKTSLLDLDREIRDIREGLQRSLNRDQFVLETRGAVRPEDLRRAMLEVKPQIVHFCGHGTGNQGLVLEDNDGNEHLASTEALSDLFRIFAEQVECVLLNACYSEVQADALFEHINYVIGMNREVRDDAAIAFTVGFYDALGAGESIERAFEIARNAVLFEVSERGTPSRKLGSVGENAEGIKNQEHLIPVLKKRNNFIPELDTAYKRLQKLLEARSWQQADLDTFALMLKIAGCERKGYLDTKDINEFPERDLQLIDQLWITHSNHHFGFSIQKEIWLRESVGGNPHAGTETFRRFGDCVGWRINSKWLNYSKLTFSLNSPIGHLPWGGWGDLGRYRRWRSGYLYARPELKAGN